MRGVARAEEVRGVTRGDEVRGVLGVTVAAPCGRWNAWKRGLSLYGDEAGSADGVSSSGNLKPPTSTIANGFTPSISVDIALRYAARGSGRVCSWEGIVVTLRASSLGSMANVAGAGTWVLGDPAKTSPGMGGVDDTGGIKLYAAQLIRTLRTRIRTAHPLSDEASSRVSAESKRAEGAEDASALLFRSVPQASRLYSVKETHFASQSKSRSMSPNEA